MGKKETAYANLMAEGKDHYNCCQATLNALCEENGLDCSTAKSIAFLFGGGMQRKEVCGVITGALMVLGLHFGEDEKAKQIAKDFMDAFEKKHGSIMCRDLKPEGEYKPTCAGYVSNSVGMLEEIIEKNK